MAALPVFERDIPIYEYRVAGGSGSKFRNGDTLLARITPCLENGKGGLVRNLPDDGQGHGSTEFIVMRAHCKSDEYFVYYLSRLPEFRTFAVHRMSGTSGRQRVNWQSLTEFEFPSIVSHLRESIGSILAALDDKIDLNRRMNETLEAMARTIFKDWFIDFGPTRAKAEGRAPYLAPELWALFPNALDYEGKPVGWEQSSMGAKIETRLGGTPARKKPDYWGGDIPWINSGKVNEFRVISAAEFITTQGFNNSATKILPKRTTLIAITGATLGQVSLNEIEVCTNQSIVGAVGNDEMPGEFLYLWVIENIGDLLASQTGAAQQHINKGNVNDLELLCPSRSAMEAWIEIARPIFDQIAALCFEGKTLARIRDFLLPKLISGEIPLRDAEKTVETVA